MKLFAATQLGGTLLVGFSIQGAFAAPALLQRPRDVAGSSPKFPYDPSVSKYCVWWIDSDGTWTCQALRNVYGVEPEDFIIWNPSLKASACATGNKLPANVSYCVSSMEFTHFPPPKDDPPAKISPIVATSVATLGPSVGSTGLVVSNPTAKSATAVVTSVANLPPRPTGSPIRGTTGAPVRSSATGVVTSVATLAPPRGSTARRTTEAPAKSSPVIATSVATLRPPPADVTVTVTVHPPDDVTVTVTLYPPEETGTVVVVPAPTPTVVTMPMPTLTRPSFLSTLTTWPGGVTTAPVVVSPRPSFLTTITTWPGAVTTAPVRISPRPSFFTTLTTWPGSVATSPIRISPKPSFLTTITTWPGAVTTVPVVLSPKPSFFTTITSWGGSVTTIPVVSTPKPTLVTGRPPIPSRSRRPRPPRPTQSSSRRPPPLIWSVPFTFRTTVSLTLGTPVPTPAVTPTRPTNGVATPSPFQPGIVDDCSAFYLTKKGDSCIAVADANGISLADFLAWNTGVGGQACGNLWADTYVCVGLIGRQPPPPKPTPTRPNTGVVTPQPIQSGMTGTCKSFYLVEKGDNCWSISTKYGIPLELFLAWNPAAGKECASLWAGTYACVGVL